MRSMLLVSALLGATRLQSAGGGATRDAAKQLAQDTNAAVDAQEARGLAQIQQLKDQNAAKDQVITDTQAALDLAKANEVDQELIDAIQAIKTNAEDNFAEAQETAGEHAVTESSQPK